MSITIPKNVPEALVALQRAEVDRNRAEAVRDFAFTDSRLLELGAAELDAAASSLLKPPEPLVRGNGAEIVPVGDDGFENLGVQDVLTKTPDMLNATASLERLELTGSAMVLAVDTAQSVAPRNAIEQMLTHQLAAVHQLGMKHLKAADNLLTLASPGSPLSGWQSRSQEAVRLSNAAARMFSSFAEGALTLQKLRTSGKQSMTVTHVHQQVQVSDGGQAVVAGTVRPRKRGKRSGGVGE